MSNKKNNEFHVGDKVLYLQKRYTIKSYNLNSLNVLNIELDDGNGITISLNSVKDLTKMLTENDIQFAFESITEILDFANETVSMEKDESKGGGNYGVSLTVLIACAFDAMGRIALDKNNNDKIDKNDERFKIIQDNYAKNYGFINNEFVDIFYKIYRCGLVHSGTIAQNHVISNKDSSKKVIVHDTNGVTILYLGALITMANEVFEQLCADYNISENGSKFLRTTITGDTQMLITVNAQDTEL